MHQIINKLYLVLGAPTCGISYPEILVFIFKDRISEVDEKPWVPTECLAYMIMALIALAQEGVFTQPLVLKAFSW